MIKKITDLGKKPNKSIEAITSFTSLSSIYLRGLSEFDFKRLIKHLNQVSKVDRKQRKEIKRYLKNKRNPYGKTYRHPLSVIAGKKKKNIILDTFAPERQTRWIKPSERKENKSVINIQNFSFIDNPNYTLNTLINVAKHEIYDINAIINFNDDNILDIAPYMIWGIMNQSMFPFFVGGNMNHKIKAVLKAVGVQEFLGQTDVIIPQDVFPLLMKQKNDFGDKQLFRKNFSCSTIEKTKNELTSKINEWLRLTSLSLTPKGEAKLSGIVNEVLDNAERHGSESTNSGNWAVAGVMQKKDNTDYYCYLAFVNTGQTIATTINNADSSTIIDNLNDFVKKHSSIFKKYDANALSTLYALQDSVSSKTNDLEVKGGFGLMDTIEFINILGFSSVDRIKPAICIISGDSCILFKDKYYCCSKTKPRVQFFNDENIVDRPPDDGYVFKLENSFPGTIITTRFVMDSSAVERYKKVG